ncbi:hypothetical protein [Olivibacter ginsenosidimutans]
MKKTFFKALVKLNKWLLPSLIHQDPSRLTKKQKAILAWRYWTLINAK